MKDLIKLLTSQLHTIFGQEASIYALDGVTSENLTTAGWKAGEGRRNSWKKYTEISRILTLSLCLGKQQRAGVEQLYYLNQFSVFF